MANGKKGDQQRIPATERRLKVLAYRKTGASFRQIADTLAVSLSQTHDDYRRAIDELHGMEHQSAEELRTLENARLDEMQLALWPQVRNGNLKAIGMALRIQERRARLNGIDLQPGAEMPVDLAIIMRWAAGRNIIAVTPHDGDRATAIASQSDGGSTAPGAVQGVSSGASLGQVTARLSVMPDDRDE